MYYSYPNDFVDPNDAKNYCAEQALKELRLKYNKNRSLLLTNDRDILERIPPMLEKHAHGELYCKVRMLDFFVCFLLMM